MKAVFLDRATFPTHITFEPPSAVTDWKEYGKTTPDQRLSRCQNADIIVTNKVVIDRDLISQLPQLKLIAVTATGTNNIDLDACRDHQIQVVNATDYGTHSVAEHTLMLMLALSRQLRTYLEANERRSWSQSPFFCDLLSPISTLHGKRLTILGRGTLGSAVADLASALGMDVCFAEHRGADPVRPGYIAFESALRDADVVSLHCPLTDDTYQLINQETLSWMKPTALLINTGRGDLVNETDLLHALKNGDIAGAALDVASVEPPAEDALIWALQALPNVIITPHIAWASDEAMNNLIGQILQKIADFSEGNPVNNLAGSR
ncbi:D-2-hydroxyacid dehydrogenase [Reinekea blandensis]|uniref:D-lactate dehydrogenase n=1 Tax=Reinekea blandensis MED297 TaxID=314283 RepID=A4BI79_9GAMM|nr:D-2-hydroxyacid dehydrogenase [Reinekea blandensis]EAR08222.1 D-lactate dehydrogenase [Reinekea sp. MED297] [Reinekea blandensis MED297]